MTWDVNHGAIPDFLTRMASLFPDEVFDLLLRRIELKIGEDRVTFRSFGLVNHDVSFTDVPEDKRRELGGEALRRLINTKGDVPELAELFWRTAGLSEAALDLMLEVAPEISDQDGLKNLCVLIERAPSRLAFTSRTFVKAVLGHFTGEKREKLVEAFARQAHRIGMGLFAGNPESHLAEAQQRFSNSVADLSEDADLQDLFRFMQRLT